METAVAPEPSRFLIVDSAGSRRRQEDAATILTNTDAGTALLVVCDGVGSSSEGGAAARSVQQGAEAFWKKVGGVLEHPAEDLARFCRAAHDEIRDEHAGAQENARTTLVVLYLNAARAWWLHSGDSRLYHFRRGRLLTRTLDHSVVEVLVQQGSVAEREMGSHPDQGRLLQSLGGADYKPPDAGSADLTPDDAFLLCTDGFWARTTREEMAEVLYAPRAEVEALLTRMLERTAQRNGSRGDNLTVAVALPERTSPPRQRWLKRAILLLIVIELILASYYLFTEWARLP